MMTQDFFKLFVETQSFRQFLMTRSVPGLLVHEVFLFDEIVDTVRRRKRILFGKRNEELVVARTEMSDVFEVTEVSADLEGLPPG